VGEEEGVIVQMNWRTVAIRTRSHSEIIYPNSVITKESVTSFSAYSPFMVRLPVGLGYSHPPARVKDVLLAAVTQSGVALDRPAPQVYLKSFDDFSIAYEVRFWMDDYSRRLSAQDEVNTRIWYALKRAGMEIPFPIRDVNVRMVPEDIEQRRTDSAREEVFAALRAVPLFEGLSDEQIRMVAAGSSMLGFCDGEYLVRQGEQGDSMFIVRRGDLRVEVAMPSGGVTQVALLGPGDFFGEMSLLTGEPRSASILARGEVEVVMLTKSEFASTVATDVKALERLSEALARRVAQIAERTAVSASDARQQSPRTRSDLLGRIRGFFGI
jgi:CRP-like cAMP-binding protein